MSKEFRLPGEKLEVEEYPEKGSDGINCACEVRTYKIEVITGVFTFTAGRYSDFRAAVGEMQSMISELLTRTENYENGSWDEWKEENFPEEICDVLKLFEEGKNVSAPAEDIIGENNYAYSFTAEGIVIEQSDNAEYQADYTIRTNCVDMDETKGEHYFEVLSSGFFGDEKICLSLSKDF